MGRGFWVLVDGALAVAIAPRGGGGKFFERRLKHLGELVAQLVRQSRENEKIWPLARSPSGDFHFVKEINMGSTQPLQGRIALVTGVGTGAGIGAATCREIAKNGGDVFFTYWHQYDKETHSGHGVNDAAAIAAGLSH